MEKTPEHLKEKGWREVEYRLIPPGYEPLKMWRHPTKDWTVDFTTACELQHGIELREAKDGRKTANVQS